MYVYIYIYIYMYVYVYVYIYIYIYIYIHTLHQDESFGLLASGMMCMVARSQETKLSVLPLYIHVNNISYTNITKRPARGVAQVARLAAQLPGLASPNDAVQYIIT